MVPSGTAKPRLCSVELIFGRVRGGTGYVNTPAPMLFRQLLGLVHRPHHCVAADTYETDAGALDKQDFSPGMPIGTDQPEGIESEAR